MTNYAQAERVELCDLFVRVGPDAPTLCDGWKTSDLAAHLVIRERRLDAGPGMLIGPLSKYTDSLQRKVRDRHSWSELIDLVRAGPPFPLRIAPIDKRINTGEYFIHHEDVRRCEAGWEPRILDSALERSLWSGMQIMATILMRSAPCGVTLDAQSYGKREVKRSSPGVVVKGLPSELLLFCFGRSGASRVTFEGDPGDISKLVDTRFGF